MRPIPDTSWGQEYVVLGAFHAFANRRRRACVRHWQRQLQRHRCRPGTRRREEDRWLRLANGFTKRAARYLTRIAQERRA